MQRSGSSLQWWRKILQWPAFLAVNLAIFLLIGISTVRETYRGWTVEREIHALNAQAQTLEDHKLKLVQLTKSLSDPEQVDLQARARLGMKKAGERVVVLTGWQTTTTDSAENLSLAKVPNELLPEPNPQLWLSYFFHTQ